MKLKDLGEVDFLKLIDEYSVPDKISWKPIFIAGERKGSNFKGFKGLVPESQGQSLALTVLCTPYLLGSGWKHRGVLSSGFELLS